MNEKEINLNNKGWYEFLNISFDWIEIITESFSITTVFIWLGNAILRDSFEFPTELRCANISVKYMYI